MRREFAALVLLILAAGLIRAQEAAPVSAPIPPAPDARSIVYVSRDPPAITRFEADPARVRGMVDRLVTAVTGQSDTTRAWASLVQPDDRIGIKVSAGSGAFSATHAAVVNAILDGLAAAGHPRKGVIVWDRDTRGYLKSAGCQVKSIEPIRGYDPAAAYAAPLSGKLIWGDLLFTGKRGGATGLEEDSEANLSNKSHFARIVTQEVTKIINVPVLRDSALCGIEGALFNMTVPNVDNWRRFTQMGRDGDPYIAELYARPVIRGKVVLTIMDGLIGQYAGGPDFRPGYSIHSAAIYASKDPVALDFVALRQLEQWRADAKLPKIGSRASHIETAAQMALGNALPDRVELKSVGPGGLPVFAPESNRGAQ